MRRPELMRGLEVGWLGLAMLSSAVASAFYIARSSVVIDGARYFTLFDDAMISMRYARNLAHGSGLRWNPRSSAVEGFTNPLWTLWMVVPHELQLSDALAPLFVSVSGAVFLVLNVATTWLIGRRLLKNGAAPLVAASVVALSYPLMYWTLRGMEVGAIALLLQLGVYAVLQIGSKEATPRHWIVLALVLVLLPLTRPDGIVPAGVLLVFGLVQGRPRPWRACVLVGLPAFAILTSEIMRVFYYGEWLPNTYYLKLGGTPIGGRLTTGTGALWQMTREGLWLPFALAVAGPFKTHRGVQVVGSVVAAQLAYVIWIGGDSWEWMGYSDRFVSCVLPLLVVLAVVGALADERPPRRALAACAFAFAWMVTPHASSLTLAWADPFHLRSAWYFVRVSFAVGALLVVIGVVLQGKRQGTLVALVFGRVSVPIVVGGALVLAISGTPPLVWLSNGGAHVSEDILLTRIGVAVRAHTEIGCRIAVVWAGTIPYHAHRTAVDLLGKSDPVVARAPLRGRFSPGHDRWNYEHSIGRERPDLVLQLWHPNDADFQAIAAWGYERLPLQFPLENVYVRADSGMVKRSRLAAALLSALESYKPVVR